MVLESPTGRELLVDAEDGAGVAAVGERVGVAVDGARVAVVPDGPPAKDAAGPS
jgi:hypothetical protein